MANSNPDIAGFYITDDYIDVAYGADPDINKKSDSNIRIIFGDEECDTFRTEIEETDKPSEAIFRAVRALREATPHIRSICIGVYGPFVSLREGEHGYGKVQAISSYRLMHGIEIVQEFEKAFSVEFERVPKLILVENDTACAALGETFQRYTQKGEWIDGGQSQILAFIKVSRGIGGAICQAANPYHGRIHSEFGQVMVRKWRDPWRDPQNDEERFEGIDPYAGRLESLTRISAIEERFGEEYTKLVSKPEHAAWYRQAWYLAQLCLTITAVAAPSKIVVGGRVMSVPGLLEKTRFYFRQMLGGDPHPKYDEAMQFDYIDRDLHWTSDEPGRPGVIGALVLAAVRSRRVQPEIVR